MRDALTTAFARLFRSSCAQLSTRAQPFGMILHSRKLSWLGAGAAGNSRGAEHAVAAVCSPPGREQSSVNSSQQHASHDAADSQQDAALLGHTLTWEVYREDDNANTFVLQRFADKAQAQAALAAWDKRQDDAPHKQGYFLRAVPETSMGKRGCAAGSSSF